MRQAIITKYLGPTNSLGARVKASAQAGSKTIPWNYGEDDERNHLNAAIALANSFGWKVVAGGATPDGNGYAFVLEGSEVQP